MTSRVFFSLLVLAACKSPQSFHDGVQALCEIADHVPDTGDRYDKRLELALDWGDRHITNPEAREIGDLHGMKANKARLAAAVAKAGIAHCKLLDNDMELQTFNDAMKIVCDAPIGPDTPRYLQAHLLNTEVVRLIGGLGKVNPADRARLLQDAATRGGIARCAALDNIEQAQLEHVPHVTGGGLVDVEPGPKIMITTSSVAVDGHAVVSIKDGAFDPADLEGGAPGMLIPKLRDLTKAMPPVATPVQLLVEPTLTYRALVTVMFSAQSGGVTRFALVVDDHGKTKAIPIDLPSRSASPPTGVQMVLAIKSDDLVLWSFSGEEGTAIKPKLSVPRDHIADLQHALAEIVDRRWMASKRADIDREIIVQAEGATATQTVAEVLTAVRAMPDGKQLFSHVLLSIPLE